MCFPHILGHTKRRHRHILVSRGGKMTRERLNKSSTEKLGRNCWLNCPRDTKVFAIQQAALNLMSNYTCKWPSCTKLFTPFHPWRYIFKKNEFTSRKSCDYFSNAQEVRPPSIVFFFGVQTFTLNNRAAQSVGWGEGSQLHYSMPLTESCSTVNDDEKHGSWRMRTRGKLLCWTVCGEND